MDRKLICEILGISEKSFYRWRKKRKIFKILDKYFTSEDLKEYIETDNISKLNDFLEFKNSVETKEYQDFLEFKRYQEFKQHNIQ